MDQILIQIILTIVSWLGIPIAWISGYRGKRRIRQPFAGIITNLGPLIMVVPWIVMPFLAQPHIVGLIRIGIFVIGILLLVAFLLITIWATPSIAPAAKKGGDELDPEFLVVKGPYKWVRHPQYLAIVFGIIGLALLLGGLYSILLCPVSFLLFRSEAYLEENLVLEPKFGEEFQQFKQKVRKAIFGRIGTIILLLIYLVFVLMIVLGIFTTS